MKIETLTYEASRGWSRDFPPLDSAQTLLLVFGSVEYCKDPSPLHALVQAYPEAVVLGCSTAGEIYKSRLQDDSLVVAVAQFEKTRLRLATSPVLSHQESFQAGVQLGQGLRGSGLRHVLVVCDGLLTDGAKLVSGLSSVLPLEVSSTGGLAGDGGRFDFAWVLDEQRRPQKGFAAAVGLYGSELQVGYGSQGGWDRFGIERTITKSKGNILYEIDGRPALSLYKEYLGERVAGLPGTAMLFPFSIRSSPQDPRLLVRTVLRLDEKEQALIFTSEMPEGWRAQLMRANFDRLIGGAAEAARMCVKTHAWTSPCLALSVSCACRRHTLHQRIEEEVEAVADMLPAQAHHVGFYAYGELAPCQSSQCELHNQTMTLTLLNEV